MRLPDRPTRIWITRTQPGADATAARIAALGAEPVVAPVLEAQTVAGAEIDLADADALAFTSGHGVRAFAALTPRRDLQAFCVGEATAALARELDFSSVRSGGGDVLALAELIAGGAAPLSLVVCAGTREPAADLPALLAERGIAARAAVVYRTAESGLAAAPKGVDAVLVHSAAAARVVARLVGDAAASMVAFAISEAAARPLRERPFRRIEVAGSPDEAALIDLIRVDRDAGRTHEKP